MPGKRRIGILGGSFDPVHLGHLHVANAAMAQLGLAEVRFLPAPSPPHKQDQEQTPVQIRAELVKLAIADEPRFVLDESEMRWGGVSYTYDTLVRLKSALPDGDELCFLIGGDSLRDLPKWYRASDLVSEFTLVTIPRPADDPADAGTDKDARDEVAPTLDAFTRARLEAAFPPEPVAKLLQHVLRVRPLAVSSTEIRARCQDGADASELAEVVPGAVAHEIVRLGLYRSPGSTLSGGG